MKSNVYNGVRAEPKFLKDPTSLESISSGISRISSYVTSNLPKRKNSQVMASPFDPQYQQYLQERQQQQQQQFEEDNSNETDNNINTTEEEVDQITFGSFEQLDKKSCLLLGYHDGFQIWDVTNPDNVHELCSIRDKDVFGTVSFIHVLDNNKRILAIISETSVSNMNHSFTSNNSTPLANTPPGETAPTNTTTATVTATVTPTTTTTTTERTRIDSNNSQQSINSNKKSHLILYSLKSQSVIKEIYDFTNNNNNLDDDDTTVVTCIKSNQKVIALGCRSRHRSSIHILSLQDYTPLTAPLTDIFHDPVHGPVFTLGSRFIAYSTNTAVLNSDPVMTSLTNKNIGYSVLQGDKDVKGAAKDIAKEVVSGMKTLGEFGLSTLSNYFNNTSGINGGIVGGGGGGGSDKTFGSSPNNRRTSSTSPNNRRASATSTGIVASPINANSNTITTTGTSTSNTTNTTNKMMPSGMIMIRDINKLPTTPTRNLSQSIISHFRPHTHPISCLTFNPAGTLLLSASKQGHTFHIFSILSNTNTNNTATHLYSLSRGITDAQVEDCQFSLDSTWCAISTARGTTHVYAINPYGGKPEISGHVHGKVNNPIYHPFIIQQGKLLKPINHSNTSNNITKATTLNSVVRIKQRRKMPESSGTNSGSSQDDLTKYMIPPNGSYSNSPSGHGYYGPTPPHYMPILLNRGSNTNNNGNNPLLGSMSGHPAMGTTGSGNSKEPKAKLTSMFVMATKSPYLVNNSVYNKGGNGNGASGNQFTTVASHGSHDYGSSTTSSNSSTSGTYSSTAPLVGTIKQQATNMLSSFGSSMSQLSYQQSKNSNGNNSNNKWDNKNHSDGLMFGFDEEYDDSTKMVNDEIGYQDMYSFHPDGILTLHRCWVAKTVVKKRENGRNVEKLDLSLKEEDVAEWKVARNSEWDQVKVNLGSISSSEEEVEESDSAVGVVAELQGNISGSKKKKKNNSSTNNTPPQQSTTTTTTTTGTSIPFIKSNKLWLSNAEITTYAANDEPPLWTHHQFSFQTYQSSNEVQHMLNAGIIPNTDKMIVLKGMPEPISSRIDRVKKTTTRIANDNVEENMDDALAELEDNISKAMQTSFSPSNSYGHSPATGSSGTPLKWLSTSATTSSSPFSNNMKATDNKNSSVSFEDAFLITVGSGPSPETPHRIRQQQQNMHGSSLIQFDDDDEVQQTSGNNNMETSEDAIRLQDDLYDENDVENDQLGTYINNTSEVYSPDGDNEVANPSDSIFGDFGGGGFIHNHGDSEEEDEENHDY